MVEFHPPCEPLILLPLSYHCFLVFLSPSISYFVLLLNNLSKAFKWNHEPLMEKISLKSLSCFYVLLAEERLTFFFFSCMIPHIHCHMTVELQKNPKIILGGLCINFHTVQFSKQLLLNSSSVWKSKPTWKTKGLKDLFQLSNLLPDVLGLCQHRQRVVESQESFRIP